MDQWSLALTMAAIRLVSYISGSAARALRQGCRWFDARALGVRHLLDVDEVEITAVLSPAAVRRRGWSPELMEALLAPPDYAVVDPQGRNDPLILFSRERVERVERSEEFFNYLSLHSSQSGAVRARINKWIALGAPLTG
jgi:hypothetical protein